MGFTLLCGLLSGLNILKTKMVHILYCIEIMCKMSSTLRTDVKNLSCFLFIIFQRKKNTLGCCFTLPCYVQSFFKSYIDRALHTACCDIIRFKG